MQGFPLADLGFARVKSFPGTEEKRKEKNKRAFEQMRVHLLFPAQSEAGTEVFAKLADAKDRLGLKIPGFALPVHTQELTTPLDEGREEGRKKTQQR